jgi:hypothetical protein
MTLLRYFLLASVSVKKTTYINPMNIGKKSPDVALTGHRHRQGSFVPLTA